MSWGHPVIPGASHQRLRRFCQQDVRAALKGLSPARREAVRPASPVTTAVGKSTVNVLKSCAQSNTEGKVFLVTFGRC